MTNEVNRKECKGCHVFMDHRCSFTDPKYVDKCPCKICLIKGVCETACEEYIHYYDKWHEERFEKSYKMLKRAKE